jgi:hypothetical protein
MNETTKMILWCVGTFSTFVVIGIVYYYLDTKVENLRRSMAVFSRWLSEDFGLELLAKFFECWSVGDKSGMIAVGCELVRIVIDPARRRLVLLESFDKMVQRAKEDPERRARLFKQCGVASLDVPAAELTAVEPTTTL